jgi:23S rRNA (adenine2503-C2)-methyltransferase
MEIVQQTGLRDLATVHVARMRGPEGPLVEFVDGLDINHTREEKWIINVSTQFGCPVKCRFCDAAGDYRGNCSAQEILDQVTAAAARHPDLIARCRKLKVHFARMGEPALNDAVLEAIERLPAVLPAKNLWCCVATVAPAGRREWFDALAGLQRRLYPGRFQLQFSINSTDERERLAMMPIALEDLSRIAARGAKHFRPGDRKPSVNFALARDAAFDPRVIIRLFDPRIFAVKLTPLNPTFASARNGLRTILRGENEEALRGPVEELRKAGFDVILSIGDPREDFIGANCGQAVRRYAQPTVTSSEKRKLPPESERLAER